MLILTVLCFPSDITEKDTTVRNVTSPVSCAQDRGLTPAGPAHHLFWSSRELSCVWKAACPAFTS